MSYVLGPNQYGKAENRVVRLYRDSARHEIRDLNVSTSLRGDFRAAHETGDQANVLPTDTQKNTAFAFAKEHGVTSPEDYALTLGARFLDVTPAAAASRIEVEEYAWDRIEVGGSGHDHAFVKRGSEARSTVVTRARSAQDPDQTKAWVVSGVKDLVVLKSTGSEFKGFLKDEYTTLQETDDRILATSLVARWRYEDDTVAGGIDWNKSFEDIRQVMLETFATTYSRALQESLYAMGSAVLEAHPEVAEVKFSAPNKHHFLVDLSPFGLDNPGEVFVAADRPYGLIEATVQREDASDPGDAWLTVPGFC
ncbi:MAG: urate oxidase [Pedococcus sp.]